MKILLKITVFLAILGLVQGQCKSGDSYIDGLCYSFSVNQLPFPDAKTYCHSIGQSLATVSTQKQDTFLSTLMRSRSSTSVQSFWIGLSRPAVNMPFAWDDGGILGWSNFDSTLAKDDLFVAESTSNGKWQTLDGKVALDFVCSYDSGAGPSTAIMPTASPRPAPTLTCLFMVDLQSAGIDVAATMTYENYYNFAYSVVGKLNAVSDLTGYVDSFGYSGQLTDHQSYPTDSFNDLSTFPFPIDSTDDTIDLDLKNVNSSLVRATWVPLPQHRQTCLILFSAAPEAEFGGTAIRSTYSSFETVIGVLIGGATEIPGLTNVVVASNLSDSDANAVVQALLSTLP